MSILKFNSSTCKDTGPEKLFNKIVVGVNYFYFEDEINKIQLAASINRALKLRLEINTSRNFKKYLLRVYEQHLLLTDTSYIT